MHFLETEKLVECIFFCNKPRLCQTVFATFIWGLLYPGTNVLKKFGLLSNQQGILYWINCKAKKQQSLFCPKIEYNQLKTLINTKIIDINTPSRLLIFLEFNHSPRARAGIIIFLQNTRAKNNLKKWRIPQVKVKVILTPRIYVIGAGVCVSTVLLPSCLCHSPQEVEARTTMYMYARTHKHTHTHYTRARCSAVFWWFERATEFAKYGRRATRHRILL